MIPRREVLRGAASALGAGFIGSLAAASPARGDPPAETPAEPFGYCLNTSTIREHKLSLVEELELAAKTGYRGVEVWVHEIDEYQRGGGTLDDLKKRIADLGISIPGLIAFPEWMVDDPDRRAKGLEEARKRMEQAARIGCPHIAAPPAGNVKGVDLLAAAERYRELLKVGEAFGVRPAVELWGFAQNLHRIGQVAMVAIESGHPGACLCLDAYHIHRGGSSMAGVRLLNGAAIAGFHINDYPGEPRREEMKDSHRVFPGDGVAPLKQLFRDLRDIGYRGMLSLELFNREYYRRPAAEVAKEGLEKTRAAVKAALG